MPIIKIQKRDPGYVQLSNQIINDTRLSWKSKGVLVYLLSKPNNWKVQVNDLTKRSPDGEYAVRSALNELINHGYATRERTNLPDGTFSWDYTIREQPLRGFPHMDNPHVDNRDISNKELSNKEEVIDEEEKKKSVSVIFKAYESEIGMITPAISESVQDAIVEYPEDWIIEAIKVSARNNARAWSYIDAILKRWKVDGFKTKNGKKNGTPASTPPDYTAMLPQVSDDDDYDDEPEPILSVAPELASAWSLFKSDMPRPAMLMAGLVVPASKADGTVTMVALTEDALEYGRSRWQSSLERIFMADVEWVVA